MDEGLSSATIVGFVPKLRSPYFENYFNHIKEARENMI